MNDTNGTAKKRKTTAERDQDVLELQVMAKAKRWLETLRSGKARRRVAEYLLASVLEKEHINTPRPVDPKQPDLPATDPGSAVKIGSVGGSEDVP